MWSQKVELLSTVCEVHIAVFCISIDAILAVVPFPFELINRFRLLMTEEFKTGCGSSEKSGKKEPSSPAFGWNAQKKFLPNQSQRNLK